MNYFSLQLQKLLWKKTALKQLVLTHVNNKFIVLTAMMLLKYAGLGNIYKTPGIWGAERGL